MPLNHRQTYHTQTAYITNTNLATENTQVDILSNIDIMKTEVVNELQNLNIDTSSLATESTLTTLKNTVNTLNGKISACDTSSLATEATLTSLLSIINQALIPALFLSLSGLSEQNQTQINLLNDISNDTSNLDSVIQQEGTTISGDFSSHLISGIHRSSFPSLNNGEAAIPHLSSEGVLLNAPRCIDATFIDGVSNTQKLERDCSGTGYVAKAAINYVYNGSTWDRLRGNTNGLQVQNIPKTIQQHRADGNVYVASSPFNTQNIYYFHNPTGSGKNAYIFNIILATQNDCNIKLHKCNNVITSQSIYDNLDFSAGRNSVMKFGPNTASLSGARQLYYFYCDTGGTTVINDFKESFIKVTPGKTLAVEASATISTTLEWIETAEDI